MPQLFQTLQSPPGSAANPGAQQLTDDQIAQLRQYAAALQGGKQPVHHWLQGLNNMTGDVVGALQQRRANDAMAQRADKTTKEVQKAANSYYPPGALPAPYAQPNTDWSGAQPLYNTGMDPFAQPVQTGSFTLDPSLMSTG